MARLWPYVRSCVWIMITAIALGGCVEPEELGQPVDDTGGTTGGGTNSAPTVRISSPTQDSSFFTSASMITLAGTARDDGSVVEISWNSDRGGSGTANGTTSWEARDISLREGSNVITVSARDDDGRTARDSITVTRPNPNPNPGAVTGLMFPNNGDIPDGDTVRFQFTSPLPAYPATYIWQYYPKQQSGYYTTFFWGNDGNFRPSDVYYGFHPYPDPPPSGSQHQWEISVNGGDIRSRENVVYETWYTQVARVYIDGSERVLEFYWDWPNTTSRVILERVRISDQPNQPARPVLTFGDAPWAQGKEMMSGIIRGIQVYDSLLSLADVTEELASPGSRRSPWYLNLNPTPSDISDKSGNGNDPVWVGPLRPTLYRP